MTAEEIGCATDRLFEGGANEVYTIPIGMKKSRPGTLLRLICKPQDVNDMVKLMYKHTSTTGVRETLIKRFILDRKIEAVETAYGEVRVKTSSGYGVEKRKTEYDDIARIAIENDLSLADVRKLIEDNE